MTAALDAKVIADGDAVTGTGVGDAVGTGVGVEVGTAVGTGVAVGDGDGVAVGAGVAVAAAGVGDVEPPPHAALQAIAASAMLRTDVVRSRDFI